MEPLSIDKYLKIISNRWKVIVYFILAFFILAILYGVFLYTPTYKSQAKILLKQDQKNTFVTELNSNNEVSSYVGQNNNPLLTQIEILSSKDIVDEIINKLINIQPDFKKYDKVILSEAIQKRIKLTNPPGTDIIDVTVKWDNPEDARNIAKLLLDSYYNYAETIHKESISNAKTYIENQLKKTNDKLASLREDIKQYRTKNSSLNIDYEAQSIISQMEKTKNLVAETEVNISATNKKVKELSKNIGVDIKKAVESVALGQSESMLLLNQKLMDDQQKLSALKVKYPESTPQIRTLKTEINQIKDQIRDQTVRLIGNKKFDVKGSIISDNVRSGMVADYVKNSVDLHSFKAQKATLQKIIKGLSKNQKSIPEVQKTLQTMQEREKTLTLISETLSAKLVEAQIKESAIVSNIEIVEKPNLPIEESFPTFLHIIIIFVLTGFLMGVTCVLVLYYLEDICDGAEDLESIIKAPVLGIIPWLTGNSYNSLIDDYHPHSVIAIIYQKIATSIKIKCYKEKMNSIGVISSELEKNRSIISASLAKTFAKSGDRVILIDIDFRDGLLTREFNKNFKHYPDITDCLMELSRVESENVNYGEIVQKYILQVENQENLFIIPNNNKVDNPYEILNSVAIPKLFQVLKANFDFVIVDTPPMLAVSDPVIASQFLDGLIVLSGVKTSRSQLRKIKKICSDNYIEIIGAIARDTLTELEVPENKYIKKLSSNPKEDLDSEIKIQE